MLIEPNPKLYFFIAQGMITIDNVDDAEEMRATDEAFNILNFPQVKKKEEPIVEIFFFLNAFLKNSKILRHPKKIYSRLLLPS